MGNHKVVLDEHAQLDVLLRELRTISRWDPGLLAQEQVRLKLAENFRALKLRLRRHFDTEESGAYMDEISSRQPTATYRLQALQAEHPIFLEQIDSMAAACLNEDSNVEAFSALLNRLSWILDLLKRHESRENDLIRDVFQT